MPKVIKGNKELTVAEEKVEEFLQLGYNQIDYEGNIIKAGTATTLKDIKAENDTLKAELLKYKDVEAENKKLKAEIKKLKEASK